MKLVVALALLGCALGAQLQAFVQPHGALRSASTRATRGRVTPRMGAGGFAWSTATIDKANTDLVAEKEKAGENVFLLWSPWDADQVLSNGAPSTEELDAVKTKRFARRGTEEIYELWGVTDLLDAKPFSLPLLEFGVDTFQPYISEQAIGYSYAGCYSPYVKKLNEIAEDSTKSLAELATAVGELGQVASECYNYDMFFKSITSKIYNGGGLPRGEVAEKIQDDIGGFDALKTKVAEAADGNTWVSIVKKGGKLEVVGTDMGVSALKEGTPILVLEVSGRSSTDYGDDQAAYLDAIFNFVNWDFANAGLEALKPPELAARTS